MRVLLKEEFSSDEAIVRMKNDGILPSGIAVRTEPDTGRRYFNYKYRLSTNIDWQKLQPYVESVGNLIKLYCDFVAEGVYTYEGKDPRLANIKIFVILKRNEASGVAWEEVEIYGQEVSPRDISEAHVAFVNKEFKLARKWSSGIPYVP
jgi:hypothetical protein